MLNLVQSDTDKGAADLLTLINVLINEKQYDGVELLFKSGKEADRNLKYMPQIAMDIWDNVCSKNLKDQIFEDDAPLYECAEMLLNNLVNYAPVDELLIELLALLEETTNDYVFTSIIKPLQTLLLRLEHKKVHTLECTLNAISSYMEFMTVPDFLTKGYDAKQQRLLEQDDDIQYVLMNYVTLGFFYGPLIDTICSPSPAGNEIFRPVVLTRRNALCCFLVTLLGKPLSLLDLSNDMGSNRYALQCARSLTEGVTKCICDPLYFLSFVDHRSCSKVKDGNMFLCDEKLPLDSLAIYYFMIFVGKVDAKHIPMVYQPLYIFESCLYLIYKLLQGEEPPLHEKGFLLMNKLLRNMQNNFIPASSLDLKIHKKVCLTMCKIIGYSSHTESRKLGIKVLGLYIHCFEDEGKYIIIRNILKRTKHHGISGYLITLYKDLVWKALQKPGELPRYYSGQEFCSILLKEICKLPRDAETDLLENCDHIISALNALIFFAVNDVQNRTGFWACVKNLENNFLTFLRTALNMSITHYKTEQNQIKMGIMPPQFDQLQLLNIGVENEVLLPAASLQLDAEQTIKALDKHLCTFDLIACVLARVVECLQNVPEYVYLSHRFAYRTLAAVTAQYQLNVRKEKKNSNQQSQDAAFKLRMPLDHRTFCTKTIKDSPESIDDFRAREERREKEFEQQQKDKAQQEEYLKDAKVHAVRTKILEAALKHVPSLGWSRNAIIQGAEEAGFPSVVHGMFPEGGFDLVSYFNGKCNEELLKILQEDTDNGTKVTSNPLEFLVRFVRKRLEMIVPYKSQWPQALALIAMPQNASTALAQVLTLVDDICYYSGDRSVDIAWYTRRIGLATILKMTELYMIQDSSPNQSKTWEFLQNRMEEAMQLQMVLQQTEDVKHKFQRSFNSAFITARNILGLNYNRH